MKKKLLLLLTLLLAACLMSGCVQSDAHIKLGMRGNVSVEMTALFEKTYLQNLMQDGQDVSAFLDETIKGNLEYDATAPDDNEGIIMEKVEEGEMCGVHMEVDYKNWEQCMASAYYSAFVGQVLPAASPYAPDGGGVTYEEKAGMLGNTYSISGSFTLDDIAALYGVTAGDGMGDAKFIFRISAPLFTAKSNASNSSLFTTEHVWEMTNGEVNIDFTAFIPNFAVLLESIAILILLIAVIVLAVLLAGKSKNEEEIIYEIDGQTSIEDVLNTEAENFFEGEEIIEDAEEVTEEVIEEVEEVTEEEAAEEETTAETTEETEE